MSDMTQEFDGPVIEPVKGIGDVKFARMTMNDWSQWAAALKQKRLNQLQTEINKMPMVNPFAKAEALARGQNGNVQLFELLDLQYTPDGIAKLLKDGYQRAGGDLAKWENIVKRIPPSRQQAIATDICSEPKPTVEELRDSLREMLKKAHRSDAGLDGMDDAALIRAAQEFKMPDEKEGGDENPLSETPGRSADETPTMDLSEAAA